MIVDVSFYMFIIMFMQMTMLTSLTRDMCSCVRGKWADTPCIVCILVSVLCMYNRIHVSTLWVYVLCS